VLIQGHFCGTLLFQNALRKAGCKARVDVRELDGYPVMMTVRAPDRVKLTTDKEMMQLVAMPASRSKEIVKELGTAIRGLQPSPICCRPVSPISGACSMPAASSQMSGSPRAANGIIIMPTT
jgi:hypothetical protein